MSEIIECNDSVLSNFLQDCVHRISSHSIIIMTHVICSNYRAHGECQVISYKQAIYMYIITISHQIKPLAFVFDPKQSGGSLKKFF